MFSASESTQAITARARSIPASVHHLVVGAAALDDQHVHLLGVLADVGVVVDHDERHAGPAAGPAPPGGRPGRSRRSGSGPSARRSSLHPAFVEQAREIASDEQLGERDEDEEHRTHAEDRQIDLDDRPAQGAGSGIEPIVATVSSAQVTPAPVGQSSNTATRPGAKHQRRSEPDQQRDAAQEEAPSRARATAGRDACAGRTRCSKRSTMRVPDGHALLLASGQ